MKLIQQNLTTIIFRIASISVILAYSTDCQRPPGKSLEEIADGISECHVNLFIDENIDLGPIHKSPVTIRRPRYTMGEVKENGEIIEEDFPNPVRLNISSTKGVTCIYHLIRLDKEEITTMYKNPNVTYFDSMLLIRRLIREMQGFFTYPVGAEIQTIQPRETFVLYFIRPRWITRAMDQIQLYLGGLELRSAKFGIRFVQEDHSKDLVDRDNLTSLARYVCIYCPDPSLIPMDPKVQEDVEAFRSFSRRFPPTKWGVVTLTATDFDGKDRYIEPYKAINPFRIPPSLLSDYAFYYFIIGLIFESTNSTFDEFPASIRYSTGELIDIKYPGFTQDEKPQVDQISFNNDLEADGLYEVMVTTSTDGFNFLTCYTVPNLSFSVYLQPFQRNLWITIAASVPILGVLCHSYMSYEGFRTHNFSPYFMMMSSLVEHSIHIPSDVENSLWYRVVIGLWFLVSVIFTNAYKGLAITGVTSPLPFDTLDHFDNFTTSKFTCYYDRFDKGCNETFKDAKSTPWEFDDPWPPEDFRLFSSLDKQFASEYNLNTAGAFKFGIVLNEVAAAIMLIRMLGWPKKRKYGVQDVTIYRLSRPIHITFPKGWTTPPFLSLESAIETELTKCDRTALVDLQSRTKDEFNYLSTHYHWHQFTLGNDILRMENRGWGFKTSEGSRVPWHFKMLVESGTYHKIEGLFKHASYQQRLNYTKIRTDFVYEPVKAIKVTGSIQTIFYIYVACIALAIITLLGEKLYSAFKMLGLWVQWYWIKLRYRLSGSGAVIVD